ncbi:UvrD-helicase domain-containing protein, partial [Microbacteriaceae bacterium K1510]|nr:UvrD-helicase domain-containing protein [Microbacteriaceae bacterium K1510]
MAMDSSQDKPDHWTDEQWQAITKRGRNLLVAAAAGSGKTSVLVERIIRRITDPSEPVGVDQLLVVTFTNAAAAEMRHRIGDALRKALETNPHSTHLRRQLTLLQRATITTIHSFCLGLLRQHYYLVDLDPDFRIADQMETELLRQDVLEAKLEEWYEQDAGFQALADVMLDGQDDVGLSALLLRLYDFSRSHPRPSRWLEQAAGMFELEEASSLSSSPWTKAILQSIRLQLRGLEAAMQKADLLAAAPEGPNAYVPLLKQEKAAIQSACEACKHGWEELDKALHSVSFQRLPAVKDVDPQVKEQVQGLRNGVKDTV